MKKIVSFTDLNAWKEAHSLVLSIYKMTDSFPTREQFALCNQIRRAAISVSSNIAGGFSRQGKKEKCQFYFVAKGSLTEIQNQLLIARDIVYISREKFIGIADQTVIVGKLISGLVKAVKS